MNRLLALALGLPVLAWIVCLAGTIALANLAGCEIHEGFANPCTVAGIDLADAAYTMGVLAAWGPLFMMPWLVGAAALWIGWATLRFILRRLR